MVNRLDLAILSFSMCKYAHLLTPNVKPMSLEKIVRYQVYVLYHLCSLNTVSSQRPRSFVYVVVDSFPHKHNP